MRSAEEGRNRRSIYDEEEGQWIPETERVIKFTKQADTPLPALLFSFIVHGRNFSFRPCLSLSNVDTFLRISSCRSHLSLAIHSAPMSESEQAAGNLDNPPQDRKEKKQMEELWKRLNQETSQLEDAYKASGESLAVDGRIFGGQFGELETVLDQLEEQVKEEEKKAHMMMGQVDKIRADTSRVDNVARRIESMKRDDWQDIQKTIGYNTAWADGMAKWINLEGWRLSRGLQHRGINTASEMTTVLWEARMSLHSLRALLQLKEGSGFGKKLDETERMIERMVPKLRELLEKEGHPTAK